MSKIDLSMIVTAQDCAMAELLQARVLAQQGVIDAFDVHVQALSGDRPFAEVLAWHSKEQAALKVLAGSASAADVAPLQAEAGQTGEAVEHLAQQIVEKAAAFRLMSGRLTGLRRRYDRHIAEAETVAAVTALQVAVGDALKDLSS